MDFRDGEDITNNKHLAEAINMTREGSAPVNSQHGYDEPDSAGPNFTLRDSCFHVAIEELQKITTAPNESQEKINQVKRMLETHQNDDSQTRSEVMAEANDILTDIWVPPE